MDQYITTSEEEYNFETEKQKRKDLGPKRYKKQQKKSSKTRYTKESKNKRGKGYQPEWPSSSLFDMKQKVLADKEIADFALLNKKKSFWIHRILVIIGVVVALSLVIAAVVFYVNVGKGNSVALYQDELPTFISVAHGSFRFSLKHNEDYDNHNSIRSIGLSAAVCDMIDFSFSQSMFNKIYQSCHVTKFRPGSVIAFFNVSFEGCSTKIHYLSRNSIHKILVKGTDPEMLKSRKITVVDPSKVGPMHGHTSHYAEYLLRNDIRVQDIVFYMKGKGLDTKELMPIDHKKVNREKNVCDWKEKGSYYAVPNTNCRDFIFCDEIEGRTYRLQCPNGTLWNNTLKICKKAGDTKCDSGFVEDLSSVVDFDAIYVPKAPVDLIEETQDKEIPVNGEPVKKTVKKVANSDVDYLEELYGN